MAQKKIDASKAIIRLPDEEMTDRIYNYSQEVRKYYNILFELYATQIEWENLPFEITRDGGELFLEKTLSEQGSCLFFKDKILNEYLVYPYAGSGLNFYNQPTMFVVNAANGYSKTFTREEAVPIYNSPYYTSEINVINSYAQKLALCDLTIMINVNTQKLPYIVKCSQGQKVTMVNLMKEIDEFSTKIFVSDDFDADAVKVYPLNSPFVGDKIYELKAKYWTEALKYCGISVGAIKKERVGQEEQKDAQDEAQAMLNTRLVSRQIAAEQINKMFGLNIKVKLRGEDKEDGKVDNGITKPEK